MTREELIEHQHKRATTLCECGHLPSEHNENGCLSDDPPCWCNGWLYDRAGWGDQI